MRQIWGIVKLMIDTTCAPRFSQKTNRIKATIHEEHEGHEGKKKRLREKWLISAS